MMTAFNLTEDQAITAITVGVDFSVSQVVNGNWGMQTIIPKVWIYPSLPWWILCVLYHIYLVEFCGGWEC